MKGFVATVGLNRVVTAVALIMAVVAAQSPFFS
jgi:hypothetical protein